MNILTIGTSIITTHFIDAVMKSQFSKIKAVYSRDMKKAVSLAYPLGALAYDDLDKALKDESIDTVYVASVNYLHFDYALKALQARKHVILEKPVTCNEEEFIALMQVANRNNVYLFEAITTLHLPNYQWIRDHLHWLGSIKHIHASYHQYSSKYQAYLNHEEPNVFNLKTGGGCLVDLNVYNLHFILSLWPDLEEATYIPVLGYNGVDLSGVAVLEYSTFIAVASASKTHDGTQKVVIEGEHGVMEVSSAANKLKQVTLTLSDQVLMSTYDQEGNALVSEVLAFEKMIQEQDVEKVKQLNEESRHVITIMSGMRRNASLFMKGEE